MSATLSVGRLRKVGKDDPDAGSSWSMVPELSDGICGSSQTCACDPGAIPLEGVGGGLLGLSGLSRGLLDLANPSN